MTKVTAELADKLAAKISDNRDQPEWEQSLWEELQWIDDLDTKQVDILFGMIVTRWNRAKALSSMPPNVAAAMQRDPPRGFRSPWHA